MFQLTKGSDGVIDTVKLRRAVNRTARNYLIQPNDYLNIQVYTNKGERLIDPNGELKFGSPNVGGGGGGTAATGRGASGVRSATEYLVQADGTVRLPLVNRVSVKGLSLIQADSVLQQQYNEFYKDSFVKTSVSNNRVIVLGASGGQVISLNNDNMNLLEVLALSGGIDATNNGGAGGFSQYGGRANNIRIIRGNLKNPQIQFIDLTTIEGMRRGNLQIEPNDIIYVQPVRRPFIEGLNSITPIFTIVSSIIGIISVAVSLRALTR
jgi:protein involved in polysaccharide export with SLBB domain